MLKAVLFDMDGVLVDTESFYNNRRAAYLASALPTYDGPWDFAGSNDRAIWETIVPDDIELRTRLHAGYDAYRATHREDYAALLNPDAPATLKALKARGLMVGIASSSSVDMIERMLQETGLKSLVDTYVSGCDMPRHKPAPDVYLACMEQLGVLPAECAVVEDSPTGIEAGGASGARVLALSQFVQPGTDQSAADVVIGRLAALAEVL
ncbi:MAG: HAD family phosphatase [Atopobiaceae bacterium]|nr:HAD family phosphatase [Atopobiaceae bacterium]